MRKPKNANPKISFALIVESMVMTDKCFKRRGLENSYASTTFDEALTNLSHRYCWLPVVRILTDAKLLTADRDPGSYLLSYNYAQEVVYENVLEDGTVLTHKYFVISKKAEVFFNYLLCEFCQENMCYPEVRIAEVN